MQVLPRFLITRWKVHLLLFLSSFTIYFIYFHSVFLNPNTLLSSIIDDSLKNYYTYAYHIKNDTSLLQFTGFNFPFGEHVVYTDCQPLLTFILHYLPFTHEYSIGILHFLIFFSFIITPSIFLSIFSRLQFPVIPSFFISIAITLLSPQYYRIYFGHYALSYTCIIPFSILLILKLFQFPSKSLFLVIFLYNFLMFFIHPYYGLGLSMFTFISITIFEAIQNKIKIKPFLNGIVLGIVPIVLFKVFMILTDTHLNRSVEPRFVKDFTSTVSSFLIPYFGPFKSFLEKFFHTLPSSFEGYAYLGITTIFITLIFILSLPFLLRKTTIKKEILAIFLSSFLLLFFSFGLPSKLEELFGLKINALNQFRALGRFSWFLYFTLPLLIFPFFYRTLRVFLSLQLLNRLFTILSIAFLLFNLFEAHYYYNMYKELMWKDRNLFNVNCLNKNEKTIIERLNFTKPQVILPLPIYFVGSEVYDRPSCTESLIISAIYSYHCKLPIISLYASRSSISDTEEGIEVLNSYKKNKPVTSSLNEQLIFAFKTHGPCMEDEKRMAKKIKFFASDDSTNYGFLTKKELLKPVIDSILFEIKKQNVYLPDSNSIIYLANENRRPFTAANYLNYEMVYVLDSNKIKSGTYNVSIHFHPKNKTFKEMSGALIVTKTQGKAYTWQFGFPFKVFSGFYNGFAVSENIVELEKGCKYEFMINGGYDINYTVSHFLLRPVKTSVMVVTLDNDTIYNNYPKE